MNVKKYNPKYDYLISSFDCENIVINNFLKSPEAKDGTSGVTYLWLTENEDKIIGFYNIEAGRVDQIDFINGNAIYRPMGGSININYLAIDKDFQHTEITNGSYYGDYLLQDCENRIFNISQSVGITFITVSVTNEAYHMYKDRNDYDDFEDDMNSIVNESDKSCYKLYKWLTDENYEY